MDAGIGRARAENVLGRVLLLVVDAAVGQIAVAAERVRRLEEYAQA